MTLNFQEVSRQIKEMGNNASDRANRLEDRRSEVEQLLRERNQQQQALQEKIASALQHNPYLRSAVPTETALTAKFPLPELPDKATLLAADGSQINPDRHSSVSYCLINVGAMQMNYGSNQAPLPTVDSRLLFDEELYTESGQITERMVALMRDLGERQMLVELAKTAEAPVISLTDGPLELWIGRENETEASAFKEKFQRYLDALQELNQIGAVTAGYIDKPRSDLVIRMLEIAKLDDSQLKKAGREYRPYRGVTDVSLFRNLLPPHHRSGIFGIQSVSAEKYQDSLALHFFYLNVGREDNPYLVRVEIPAWVATQPTMLDQLHAVLINQCQMMGGRPYPYLLHRSHEVAVVTRDEKMQVDQMIINEYHNQGINPGTGSNKQHAKDQSGRSRYKT